MRDESLRKGPWYEEEDERLKAFVAVLGERRWDSIARASGLRRSGKSCRLRWLNYLRPCLKQGPITPDEELIILQFHQRWGNKWAKIARRLPGRTDNEIKNYWRTHLRKKMQMQSALYSSPFPTDVSITSVEMSPSSDQTNNSNQDAESQEGDITKDISSNDNERVQFGPYNYDNVTDQGLRDLTVTSSPYENRLTDLIDTLTSEQNDEFTLANREINVSEFCFDYPITWNVGYSSAWDCPDTLWDIDLFAASS